MVKSVPGGGLVGPKFLNLTEKSAPRSVRVSVIQFQINFRFGLRASALRRPYALWRGETDDLSPETKRTTTSVNERDHLL